MAADGGTPRTNAGKSNSYLQGIQQQAPTLLNYSGLSGGLSVDALAGPMLFTPTPPIHQGASPAIVDAMASTSQASIDYAGTPLKGGITAISPTSVTSDVNFAKSQGSALISTNLSAYPSQTVGDLMQSGRQVSPPLVSDGFLGQQSLESDFGPPEGLAKAARDLLPSSDLTLPNLDLQKAQIDSMQLQEDGAHLVSRPLVKISAEPRSMSVDFYQPSFENGRASALQPHTVTPLVPHWFFCKGGKLWIPFSYKDSSNLETAYSNKDKDIVVTDGGRYEVNLSSNKKHANYWIEEPCYVQRCTWFFKGDGESKLIPYEPEIAEILEAEYQRVSSAGTWNQKIQLPSGDYVQMHNANVIVYYKEGVDWTGEDSTRRPHIVRRGIADIRDEIPEGEPDKVDHLVFIVHGIGPVADLDFRPINECVDDMRQISLSLTRQPNYDKTMSSGRIEFLPIKWYDTIHHDKTGVNRQLKSISLPSAMKLREFTNNTLIDILFFTSPMYSQAICDTVVEEMNRLYALFCSRNPSFQGSVSVCGHSLGTCILFDIMAHQDDKQSIDQENIEVEEDFTEVSSEILEPPEVHTLQRSASGMAKPSENLQDTDSLDSSDAPGLPDIEDVLRKLGLTNLQSKFAEEQIDTETLIMCTEADIKDLGLPMGPRKKLQSFIKETIANQRQRKSARGQENDAAATRSKPAVISGPIYCKGTQTLMSVRKHNYPGRNSICIPFFRGIAGTGQPCVQYEKLNFEPVHMFALGSPIGLFLTTRGLQHEHLGLDFRLPTCKNFFNIFHPYDPVAYRLEPLINPEATFPPVLIPHHKGRKRFHLEIKENISRVSANLKQGFIDAVRNTWTSLNEFARAHRSESSLEIGQESNEVLTPQMSNLEVDTDSIKSVSVESMQTAPERMVNLGRLNAGKRIDYVLQEKPFEILNEYLFALSSHTTYWKSEDTVLLMMREIYGHNNGGAES